MKTPTAFLKPALALLALTFAGPGGAALPNEATLRTWIEEMKTSPRGPFERIRWFCKDGTVQPPKAYACADHGGGIQHGEWTQRVKQMRGGGYAIANVLATLDIEPFTRPDPDVEALGQIVIERFLTGVDDGWIFRGARSYRGALQIEDEEAGARAALLAMLATPEWRDPVRFLLLREVVRSFPLQEDEGSAAEVRQLALVLADKDKPFTPIRAKIHNVPDAGDAAKVRAYASKTTRSELVSEYERLATLIDALYETGESAEEAQALVPRLGPSLGGPIGEAAGKLAAATTPTERFAAGSLLVGRLRDAFPEVSDPEAALAVLQSSLAVEDATYAAGNELVPSIPGKTRFERLAWLQQSARALYGAGLITRREAGAFGAALARVASEASLPLDRYRSELRFLARVPEWASGQMNFSFGPALHRLQPIEPLAHLYPQDRLRGSPLLFYSALIDSLVKDANGLAGIEHELFGQKVGAGLRGLNPGLARGVLRPVDPNKGEEQFRADGVYLLPETASDLPRIAGILTRGEGSSLSHVQLLARNLGIPNVVVTDELLDRVNQHMGQQVVIAVSPNGIVQLTQDGPRWDAVFGSQKAEGGELVIRPDLEKLDIVGTALTPLSGLRATDSGRLSGPKGANLGELKHYFGEKIPNGFVIPFGVFRKVLDQPLEKGGPSVWDWMLERYDAIAALESNPAEQEKVANAFLARLRAWIENVEHGPAFKRALRENLDRFGPDGSFGVFVRSDTNVEDLPGFTGAGLNLTVMNVVGYENILAAVNSVWASPFTERAYGWRQSHMDQPQYVFPAVVVQYSFPAEKSGVMVTTDVDEGVPGWIAVAVSEGVGGAVEGQAAESLRINMNTGEVRLLAQATAAHRTVLDPVGGIGHLPASGTEHVLTDPEIAALIEFARDVPSRFPELRDEAGNALPADVEFAFRDGTLALLQIRPFVESKSAQRSQYLMGLDQGLTVVGKVVPLNAVPGS